MGIDWGKVSGYLGGVVGGIESKKASDRMAGLAAQAAANQPINLLTQQQKQDYANTIHQGGMRTGQDYASSLAPYMQGQDESYINRLMKQQKATHINRFAGGGGQSGPSGPTAVQLGNQAHQLRSLNAQNMLGLLQQGEATRQNYLNMLNQSAANSMGAAQMQMDAAMAYPRPISTMLSGGYGVYRDSKRDQLDRDYIDTLRNIDPRFIKRGT